MFIKRRVDNLLNDSQRPATSKSKSSTHPIEPKNINYSLPLSLLKYRAEYSPPKNGQQDKQHKITTNQSIVTAGIITSVPI